MSKIDKSKAPSIEADSALESDTEHKTQSERTTGTEETPTIASPVPVKSKSKRKQLSSKEKEALTEKAQEIAAKKAKEKAEDDYLEDELKKAEREENAKYGITVDEETVRYTVNLSEASDRHIINGVHYIHGHTYEIPSSLAACMRDTEFRGHIQEDIRKGNKRNDYGFRTRDGIKSGSGVAIA